MPIEDEQRLVSWFPTEEVAGKTPSFGDIEIQSQDARTLSVLLPYEEGKLHLCFNEVRAFTTNWDGDPSPFLTFEEAAMRPSDLMRVERSRWLASDHFNFEVESGPKLSTAPWEHFFIVAQERSLHIAARQVAQSSWVAGRWSGKAGNWRFTAMS